MSYLANWQTTKVILTKGVPNKSGNMQVNKQSTLFYWNILHLHKGHWYSQSRGSVTSCQLTKMFSSQNPDDSPKACTCFSYIPPFPIARVIIVTDIMRWSSALLFSGKSTAHVLREMPWSTCISTGIHAKHLLLLLLHMNPTVFSISQISRMWHSPPGILVCLCSNTSIFFKHARMDTGCKR